MCNRKRLWACLVLFLMLFATACGATPAPSTPQSGQDAGDSSAAAFGHLNPQTPVTLSLWHYYVGENQQALESAVSAFNQSVGIEQGVIVEAVALGSIADLETAVTESAMGVINARPMPQLFSSYPDKALEIDELDMLVDLNQYFTAEEKSQYVADFLTDYTAEDGRLLLLPIVKSTELTYVNATAWNEFSAATGAGAASFAEWESLYATARAYYQWHDDKTPDTPWDGKGLIGFDSVANYIIISCHQLGVDVINAEGGGRAVLDEEVLRRVFELYYTGISLGYFDAVGNFRSDDIKVGDLIAYVGSSSSAAYFPTWIEKDGAESPIDFMALSYPVFSGGQSYAIQQGAGMCVAKSTPAQQEGAALFLKWFTATEQNIGFAMTTGYLPVQNSAYSSDILDTVLGNLRQGDAAQQNVAAVYDIALAQITGGGTYAAKPFAGSYDVRSVLQRTLVDAALAGRQKAAPLKAEGQNEEEILAALEVEAQFAAWLQAVRDELALKNIPAA